MANQMLGVPWCPRSMSPKPQKDAGKDVNTGCGGISGS